MQEFRVAVRELVAFVHRSGDLAGESGVRSANRAQEGTRGHRRVQQARGEGYEAEVVLERVIERGPVRLHLAGRVDGLMAAAEPPLVEEIKTVDARWSGQPDAVHIAQVRTYAALLAAERGWPRVEHQLTYLDLGTDQMTVFRTVEEAESLAGFLYETLEEWFAWLIPRVEWLARRNASLEALTFPLGGFRQGQRTLAAQVYRTVRDGAVAFFEAPTGLGKTLATLFPAVKALPLLGDGQVFYVTAKSPGRLAAAEALGHLRAAGARLRSVELTAKEKICFSELPSGCDPRVCPFALGYYDRIKPAVRALLERETLNRAAVEDVARAHTVCPFELSLDASLWTDVIVGDLNYVFDPAVRLQRHFGPGPARHVVLVDEAHNLVDRSRAMYSATLAAGDLAPPRSGPRGKGSGRARQALRAVVAALEASLAAPSDPLLPVRPHHDGARARDVVPDEVTAAARTAARRMEEFFAGLPPGTDLSGWLEPWFSLTAFLRAAESFDATCRVLVDPARASLRIFCTDPATRLRETLKGLRAAVFFSATLSPLAYFRDLLGGDDRSVTGQFDSPFRADQMAVRVVPADVSFKARAASLERVAGAVAAHVDSVPGNHLVFCPSLDYLAVLQGALAGRLGERTVFAQEREMDETQRGEFLARLVPGENAVGLAVLGGIFSEGVDLPGDRLVAVTVIGIGLPRLSLERDLLQTHFEATRGAGFDFAYRFPGMQRVLQAVGRLIRTESDRGSALLIDQRFTERRTRVLFPAWWGV